MQKSKRIAALLPLIGALVFIILYVVATVLYPGGSQADKNASGFSWLNNYWCNLLNEYAINGQPNPAKPVAMTGMFILCISLSSFWIIFPSCCKFRNILKIIIQSSGVISMMIAFFLFTSINHDLIINLAGAFGLVALAGTFAGLYQNKWFGLFAFGIFNLALVGLNNYVYYTPGLLVYLPLIQKISFLSFLGWICLIDLKMYYSNATPVSAR